MDVRKIALYMTKIKSKIKGAVFFTSFHFAGCKTKTIRALQKAGSFKDKEDILKRPAEGLANDASPHGASSYTGQRQHLSPSSTFFSLFSKIPLFSALAALLFVACFSNDALQDDSDFFNKSRQLVLVVGGSGSQARLSYFNKTKDSWQQVAGDIVAVLGRNGLAWGQGLHEPQPGLQKREGDGRSPAGLFRFGTTFGHLPAKEISWKMPYVQVVNSLECVDDAKSKFYNQIVDNQVVEKDWDSSERMWEVGSPYDWGVFVQHNTPAQAAGGSCIFLHVWAGDKVPTSGCTAMAQEDLLGLMAWLDPAKNPLLLQLGEGSLPLFQKKYGLPADSGE